jgi:hypothetical protein
MGTAATLGAAAEAAIDFSGRARRSGIHGATHFVVAQHVAGTDDHRKIRLWRSLRPQNGQFASGFIATSQNKSALSKHYRLLNCNIFLPQIRVRSAFATNNSPRSE